MQSLVAFYRLGAKLCLRNCSTYDIIIRFFKNFLYVLKSKLALRVIPAVTWLTVYSWLHIHDEATFDHDMLWLVLYNFAGAL